MEDNIREERTKIQVFWIAAPVFRPSILFFFFFVLTTEHEAVKWKPLQFRLNTCVLLEATCNVCAVNVNNYITAEFFVGECGGSGPASLDSRAISPASKISHPDEACSSSCISNFFFTLIISSISLRWNMWSESTHNSLTRWTDRHSTVSRKCIDFTIPLHFPTLQAFFTAQSNFWVALKIIQKAYDYIIASCRFLFVLSFVINLYPVQKNS